MFVYTNPITEIKNNIVTEHRKDMIPIVDTYK